MKKNNFKSVTLRVVAMAVCLLLATLTLASCNTDGSADKDASGEPTVKAVRALKDIEEGALVVAEDLEVVELRVVDCPLNSVEKVEDVAGKYASVKIFAGDFIFPAKLSTTAISDKDDTVEETDDSISYTLINDYKSLANGNDYTAAIKKAIEENPTKTIYFPDGEYVVTEPIVISADPAKSVSLRLSNYATIKASAWADATKAVIRLGVGEMGENILESRNVFVMGGIIDACGVATGIAIEGGRDVLISNVSIKNASCGIHIKAGNNATAAVGADVENVNITGNGKAESVGVLVEGTNNALTNVIASGVSCGLKCTETGSDNIFRSIRAIATDAMAADATLAGFYDMSTGNQYDVCCSDQFATGFLTDEGNSVYNGCYVDWWSAENNYHVGFKATGKLNSVISNSTVIHTNEVATDAYLLVGEEVGEGVILYPINSIVNHENDNILAQYCPTGQLQ